MKFLPLLILFNCFVIPVAFAQGTLRIVTAKVEQVLPIYKELSGFELVVDSRVKSVRSLVSVESAKTLSKENTVKLIKKSLLEQAGVVITPLDEKKVSVTYNDALPIKVPKDN